MVTKEELIAFETDIGECFNAGKIRAPIHLYSDNEDPIMEIFTHVKKDDWVCCTWRNHYQCLLKGVPPAELKERIMRGKSMVMCIKEHNIVCSSIVGGIPSIATGIAWGLKLNGSPDRVWCFVGDMSMETGAFHEAYKYAHGHDLPITWVVEDNGLSVETPTKEVWGKGSKQNPSILYYKYKNTKYPHAGAGGESNFDMGKYYDEIKRAQSLLAEQPNSMFIGQAVSYPGTGLDDSLLHIPAEKKFEFPIAENLQMGVCTGLALKGFLPIAVYPRWNFLIVATDQIVNHLDKLPLMSDREFVPKVIIRVAIGSEYPVDPQDQHKGDFTEAFRSMCKTINVLRLEEPADIIPAYEHALFGTKYSSILVESADYCKTR